MTQCDYPNCDGDATWPANLPEGEEPLYCDEHALGSCELCGDPAAGSVIVAIVGSDGKQEGFDSSHPACAKHNHFKFFDGSSPQCEAANCDKPAEEVVTTVIYRKKRREEYDKGPVQQVPYRNIVHLACAAHGNIKHFPATGPVKRRQPEQRRVSA